MTPALDWRAEYGAWPIASAKLSYVSRVMAVFKDRAPLVTSTELEEDVGDIEYSLGHYYGRNGTGAGDFPPGLDGALRAIFDDLSGSEDSGNSLKSAADLIRRFEPELMANVFRWTGHFPERTRVLLRYLADRAERLGQGYPAQREDAAIVALTTLVTGLAMNHVQRGSYLP
jgi:hypothetical protein